MKKALERVEDPRRTVGGHILHKLEDIIIIGLCTLLCNGEDFTDMEAFGELREEWLRKFLELPHGIPDSDTFRRVFERINPEALAECLYDWLGSHWEKGDRGLQAYPSHHGGYRNNLGLFCVSSLLEKMTNFLLSFGIICRKIE